MVIVDTKSEPIHEGKYAPTWESLAHYRAPDWFRDAKFGIWAHWGPQCEPEAGDWYARRMYMPGEEQNKFHLEKYSDPSVFGFKDVINEWHAEKWDPEKLIKLYKRAGAQYFFALANHHDNLDLWDSKYQPWNSVAVGPKKDLIAGWAKAARDNGLQFGVSVHASHAWTWYEPSQKYDGNLTKAEGAGKWWNGLDPQDLYAQRHPLSAEPKGHDGFHDFWGWKPGAATPPDQAYCDKFYNRTIDLIDQIHPDLIYFDDNVLPLWPASDAGLKIAAHYYNSSVARHGVEGVLFGKILSDEQKKTMVWDVERGASDRIEPLPWQTDTCIGDWHYRRSTFEQHKYKPAALVIHMLADIVSKNGNLLLSVPVRADGTIDEDEVKIVEQIGQWMDTNGQAIFGTRPWKIFGEGPTSETSVKLTGPGFNEGKGKPFTADDVRFTTKGDKLYAIVLGVPTGALKIKSLGSDAGLLDGKIKDVKILGAAAPVKWSANPDGLSVETFPLPPNSLAAVVEITLTK